MAIQNAPKKSPEIFSGTAEPNAADVSPTKVGDIYINTDLMTLHFCKTMTGSYKWGTAGTA